jgi:anti-anti-sigma regulatory factor
MAISPEQGRDGTPSVLRLSGRFDFSCHRAFESAYRSLPPRGELVVELGNVTYLDGAALGMLLFLRDYWSPAAHQIALASASGQPLDVLRTANFGKLFRMA